MGSFGALGYAKTHPRQKIGRKATALSVWGWESLRPVSGSEITSLSGDELSAAVGAARVGRGNTVLCKQGKD